MNQRNKFILLLAVLLVVAAIYFFFSTDRSSDMVLIGTVDANQVIVSSKISGRIEKLAVDEGSEVKQGDLIAVLDTAELEAQKRAAEATLGSLRSEARANLQQVQSDHDRIVSLAAQGIVSQQDRDRSDANLKAAQARVQAAEDQVRAAAADLSVAQARTHQAHAAESTVAATRGQLSAAEAQRAEAEARLAYARVTAPVSGTVSVRAAREGEVVNSGTPIVTIVDLSDTWVRAPIPETFADRIHLGDVLKVRLPSGRMLDGKVILKAVESDFATQRDVSRRKRDIKTFVLKLAVDNRDKALTPGLTANVLVPHSKLRVGNEQSPQSSASGETLR